jgi:hypothetical protein
MSTLGIVLKKKLLNDWGKDDEPEEEKPEAEDMEEEGDEGESLLMLAEETGVKNPKALLKLIKACQSRE